MISHIDWKLLRIPLIVLSITLIVSAICLWFASRYNGDQYAVYSKLERNFNRAKRDYNDVKRDKALYKDYLESYKSYLRKGVIGEEQRLSWIEELQRVNRDLKLPSLRYEINPQETARIPGIKVPKKITVNISTMRLTASLLHEGDILTLLDALRKNANGFYSLTECDIGSRVSTVTELIYAPDTSYVNLECSLDWYTVNVRQKADKKS